MRRTSWFRRTLMSVLALLVMTPTYLVANAGSAEACALPNGSHCYGETWTGSGVVGVADTIGPGCLSTTAGNFITDEIWLADPTNAYWIETGFVAVGSGVNLSGIATPGTYLFWGDDKPGGGGLHNHALATSPGLSARRASIYENGVYNYSVNIGTYSTSSTTNTMNPNHGIYGSEDTANSGTHSYAYFSNPQYLKGTTWSSGTNGTASQANTPELFSWGTLGSNFYAGVAC
jgi:hypothetical protein